MDNDLGMIGINIIVKVIYLLPELLIKLLIVEYSNYSTTLTNNF